MSDYVTTEYIKENIKSLETKEALEDLFLDKIQGEIRERIEFIEERISYLKNKRFIILRGFWINRWQKRLVKWKSLLNKDL